MGNEEDETVARISFFSVSDYLGRLLDAWEHWGENFLVNGTSKSQVAALKAELDAVDGEIGLKTEQLRLLRSQRNDLATRAEALSVLVRLAVLGNFPANSEQVYWLPVFKRKRPGPPTKRGLAIQKSAQLKRETLENALREGLKAELRAEIQRENAG